MTKADAIEFQKRIEKMCKEKGVWHEVKRENRPKLGKIEIVISMRVEEERTLHQLRSAPGNLHTDNT